MPYNHFRWAGTLEIFHSSTDGVDLGDGIHANGVYHFREEDDSWVNELHSKLRIRLNGSAFSLYRGKKRIGHAIIHDSMVCDCIRLISKSKVTNLSIRPYNISDVQQYPKYLHVSEYHPKIGGIYRRDHHPYCGRVAYFHIERPQQLYWSPRQDAWIVIAHLWGSDKKILARSVSKFQSPISDFWVTEADQKLFSVRQTQTELYTPMRVPKYVGRFRRRARQIFRLMDIEVQHDHNISRAITKGKHLRVKLGISRADLVNITREHAPDCLARIIASFVGSQVTCLSITPNVARVTNGLPIKDFEEHFRVSITDAVKYLTETCKLHRFTRSLLSSGAYFF